METVPGRRVAGGSLCEGENVERDGRLAEMMSSIVGTCG